MSLEKDSDGVPHFDTRRRTTKVNIGVVVGILSFFAVATGVLIFIWQRS